MNTKKLSEDELVALLKGNDPKGLHFLYDNYSGPLFGVILRIVGSQEMAEDILQDSFVKIWKKISSYDKSKGRLYTWIVNISRNTAIDSLRVKDYDFKSKNQRLDNSVRSINRQYNVSTKIDTIGLKAVVEKMEPGSKSIIDKLYFEGFTHEEAARELNMPVGTLKTKLHNAIRQLRSIYIEEPVIK